MSIDYYTLKQVAEIKNVTKQAIWKTLHKYKAVRAGNQWLIPKKSLNIPVNASNR